MRLSRLHFFSLLFFPLLLLASISFGQLGFSFDVKKPKPFEDRVLRSEKTDKLKFNKSRHFFQNTFTHYNYFFNANNKLNDVLELSKLGHRDDYSQLLSFYNYTLDETSQYKTELDSLVYKSQTAIILHDLRNDWVDNMYLIWGAAYYLRKDFDSAFLTFQFINYAFAPKEKDGYYKYIGSKMDGNTVTNIATKEKNTLPKKVFSEPPSRNDAFIWQIRTLIAMDKFAEASSLLASLKNDPVFPERLRNDLQEVKALYFYKQNMWDSAAFHLVQALSNAGNKKDRVRWKYLIGQLYENSHHYADAEDYYTQVISGTTDPVMEIYARLSAIRVNRGTDPNYIDRNIADLVKMAHRDRYVEYRDIIYFMAAQMEMERNHVDPAEKYLLKSVSYQYGNIPQRNKAFLQLESISLAKRKYRLAYNFYDSLQMGDPAIPEPEKIIQEKELLGRVAFNIETIERQDSLQRLAGLSEEERKLFVKKLVKKLRKQQGLKEENFKTPEGLSSTPQNTPGPDLFNTNQAKGDWYFYNQSLRTRGSGEFKSKWGNRPNTDNWRRAAAISGITARGQAGNNSNFGNPNAATNTGEPATEITTDALLENIPLTPEKLKKSNDSVRNALATLSRLYAEELEDCRSCIETSQELQKRFPDYEKMDEILFHLYYCYSKSGEIAKAEELKKQMTEKFAASKFTTILRTGKDSSSRKEDVNATQVYEGIYDNFIAGNFDEALEKKKVADSIYGNGYWSPQLIYIEAVYHARQREDSTARSLLTQIVSKDPDSPLGKKAANLISVLSRRTIIENELANLVIEKPAEEISASEPVASAPIIQQPQPKKDSLAIVEKTRPVNRDSTAVSLTPPAQQPKVQPNTTIKKSAADSIAVKVAAAPTAKFDYNPDDKYFVMVILDRVDNVFRNEAKNAFGIFNREKYYSQTFDYSTLDIDAQYKLLLVGGFANAQAAADYVQQAKPVANTRIMPWLKPEKYSFSIIGAKNLEILKTNLKLEDYRKFADKNFQGKF